MKKNCVGYDIDNDRKRKSKRIHKLIPGRCYNTLSGVAILQGLRASTYSACRSRRAHLALHQTYMYVFTKHSLEFLNKTYSRNYIATPRLPLCLFHAHCIDEGGDFKKELHFSFTKIKRTIAIRSYGTHTYMMMLLSRYEGCVTS